MRTGELLILAAGFPWRSLGTTFTACLPTVPSAGAIRIGPPLTTVVAVTPARSTLVAAFEPTPARRAPSITRARPTGETAVATVAVRTPLGACIARSIVSACRPLPAASSVAGVAAVLALGRAAFATLPFAVLPAWPATCVRSSAGPAEVLTRPTLAGKTTLTTRPTLTGKTTLTTRPTLARETTLTTRPTLTRETTLTTRPTLTRETTLTTRPTLTGKTTLTTRPTLTRETTLTTRPTLTRETTLTTRPTLTRETTLTTRPTLTRETTLTCRTAGTAVSTFLVTGPVAGLRVASTGAPIVSCSTGAARSGISTTGCRAAALSAAAFTLAFSAPTVILTWVFSAFAERFPISHGSTIPLVMS
ncbi:hypothetical protein [Arthrobacter sp. D2-10]